MVVVAVTSSSKEILSFGRFWHCVTRVTSKPITVEMAVPPALPAQMGKMSLSKFPSEPSPKTKKAILWGKLPKTVSKLFFWKVEKVDWEIGISALQRAKRHAMRNLDFRESKCPYNWN